MSGLGAIAPEYLIYAGLFLGVLIAVEGFRRAFSAPDDIEEIRARRIAARAGTAPSLLRAAETRSLLHRLPMIGDLPGKMNRAGMKMRPELFLTLCAALVAVLFAVWAGLLGPLLAAPLALVAGLGLPVAVINHVQRKRVEAFTAQLPDALDQMMRGLRVGHPINTTVINVARTMGDPLGGEFARIADQVAYGDNLTEAFFDLADRIDQEDVHYLAVSIGIQHGTGGNLAAMLGTLAKVIRSRAMMRRRIHAISSEGRISAMVLSALPLMIYAGTSVTAPNYYTSVSDDPLYLPIAVTIVVLVLANFLVLRKLATFRI